MAEPTIAYLGAFRMLLAERAAEAVAGRARAVTERLVVVRTRA